MTVAQVIEQVKDTLKEPSSWVQGAASVHNNGMQVPLEDGTCFCILGALWKNTGEFSEEGSDGYCAEELLHKLAKEKGFYGVPDFNDSPTTTHKDVIAFLDLAIERAKALPLNIKEQVHSFLLDVENMVKNRGEDKLEGICGIYVRAINLNFDRLCAQVQIKDGTAARNELWKALRILMTQWPEHSDHDMFPVPAADYSDPEAAYLGCKDLWGNHPYGDNRRRLLAWLLEQTNRGC